MADVPAGERVQVAAAPGVFVDVLELQIAGKKRMSAAEFNRGYVMYDVRFGPEVPA